MNLISGKIRETAKTKRERKRERKSELDYVEAGWAGGSRTYTVQL